MRLLIYSSQFPTPRDPNGGVFTAQLTEAVAKQAEVRVVCPLPWCPDLALLRNSQTLRWYAGVPASGNYGRLRVEYPKYLLPPRISGALQPWLQVAGASRLLGRMHRQARIDAINAHWVYPDGVAAVWMAKRLGVPVMLTALGSDVNVYSNFSARRRQMLWAFRNADHISAVSSALVEKIKTMGIEPEKLSHIANGVDARLFRRADDGSVQTLRRQLGMAVDRKYLLFVGRFHPVKGLSCLLDALNRLEAAGELHFDTILAGDGVLRGECERYISAHNLSHKVRLVGEVPHSSIHQWFQACDAFCLPSLMEGMPNVVLEAQACGLPVVASRVGAIPDMVGPGNGIMFDGGNSEQLAAALQTAFRVSWNKDGISRAAGLQSWDTVAARYLDTIEAAVNRRTAGVVTSDLTAHSSLPRES